MNKNKTIKNVLTIAGSDPTGGAGLQADLNVFTELKVKGFSVVTAVTAQTSKRVSAMSVTTAKLVTAQVDDLAKETSFDAVKIGMLGKGGVARAVEKFLKEKSPPNVVLDPVVKASGGFALLEDSAVKRLLSLLPLVSVVTPNLEEAALLSGRPVRTVKDMKEAACWLRSMGAGNVVIKGGHLKKSAVDILLTDEGFTYFEGNKIKSTIKKLHGTGCRFSAALAADLALGMELKTAVKEAKAYVLKTVKG